MESLKFIESKLIVTFRMDEFAHFLICAFPNYSNIHNNTGLSDLSIISASLVKKEKDTVGQPSLWQIGAGSTSPLGTQS
jgi:hypothetical protein